MTTNSHISNLHHKFPLHSISLSVFSEIPSLSPLSSQKSLGQVEEKKQVNVARFSPIKAWQDGGLFWKLNWQKMLSRRNNFPPLTFWTRWYFRRGYLFLDFPLWTSTTGMVGVRTGGIARANAKKATIIF